MTAIDVAEIKACYEEAGERYGEILDEIGALCPDASELLRDLDDIVGARLSEAAKRGVALVLPYVSAEMRPLVARAGVVPVSDEPFVEYTLALAGDYRERLA